VDSSVKAVLTINGAHEEVGWPASVRQQNTGLVLIKQQRWSARIA